MGSVGRVLVVGGAIAVVTGLLLLLAGRLGLGSLPGDLSWKSGNARFYLPLGTCLLLSLVGTVLLNLFFRR